MISLCAFVASIARWLLFPAADYPDAEHIYPTAFINAFLSDQDYSIDLPLRVLPANLFISLASGSVYDGILPALPSFKYWLLSSLPLFVFAAFSQFYLVYCASKHQKKPLRQLLILFIVCPSSAYYLCTLHPEAWANVLALGYTVSALTSAFGSIHCHNYLDADCTGLIKTTSLCPFLFFSLALFAGYLIVGDSQFILCFAGIACLYLSLTSNVFGLVYFPSRLLQVLRSAFFLRLSSSRKFLIVAIPLAFAVGLLIFSYALRDLLISSFSAQSSLGSALSLYGEDSLYADKYPLLLRPLLTVNNLFIYTPAGFGPSAFLKILILWPIVTAWFGGATDTHGQSGLYRSKLVSRLIFALLFPLPVIILLPGYVNLKYFLFLVPVLFFWPTLTKYRTLLLLFILLWSEFSIRSLFAVL